MIGILVAPAPFHPGAENKESPPLLPAWEIPNISRTLDIVTSAQDGCFFAGFDTSRADWELAVFLFMDLLGSLRNPGLSSAAILADEGHGSPDEMRVRMAEHLGAVARRDRPGRVFATCAARPHFAGIFPRQSPPADQDAEGLSDFGPLVEFGVSGAVSRRLPPPRKEDLARLEERIERLDPARAHAKGGARILALAGNPGEASRIAEGLAASLAGSGEGGRPVPVFHGRACPDGPECGALAPILSVLSTETPEGVSDHGSAIAAGAAARLARSPWRAELSGEARQAVLAALVARMRSDGFAMIKEGYTPFVVVTDADLMPEAGMRMLLDASEELRSESPLLVLAGRNLPRQVPFRSAEIMSGMGLSMFDTIQSLRIEGQGESAPRRALAVAQDPVRLGLILLASLRGNRSITDSWTRDTASHEILRGAVSSLPPAAAALLDLCARLAAIPSETAAMEALGACGRSPQVAQALLDFLARCGCPSSSALPDWRAVAPGESKERDDIPAAIATLLESGRLEPSLASFLRVAGRNLHPGTEPSCLALRCVDSEIEFGDSGAESGTPAAAPPFGLAAWLEVRKALAADDHDRMITAAAAFPAPRNDSGSLAALSAATRACMEYGDRKPLEAAGHGKAALLALIGMGLEREEARVQRLLGRCELAQGRIMQASGYFENSASLAEGAGDSRAHADSLMGEIACMLLAGDFGRALDYAELAARVSTRAFDPALTCAALFAEGRALAEIGRYVEAGESFGSAGRLASRYGLFRATLRIHVWAERVVSLSDTEERRTPFASGASASPDEPAGLSGAGKEDAEALLFASEEAFRAGNPGEAARLSSHAAARSGAAMGPASIERFSWGDGYVDLEGLYAGYSGPRSLLEDRCLAWDLFCRAQAGLADADEAALRIQALAREERIATPHPFAHLYLFWVYRLAASRRAREFDPATTFSRAFKALQTRAGRIADSSQLEDFMRLNRENAEIVAEAGLRRSR